MGRWKISAVMAVAAAVVLTATALVGERAAIENDLRMRTARVMAGEATSWASVRIVGRKVVLSGEAPSEELRSLAVRRLERLYGVSQVDDAEAGLLPLASPYFVRMSVSETRPDTLTVEGYAPSLPDKARMLASLARVAPDTAVIDELELASGMPDGFLKALDPLYRIAPLLESGEAMLRDRNLTVSGEAISNEAYDHLEALRPSPSDGYRLAEFSIVRPLVSPFSWSASRGSDGVVRVSGFAPDPVGDQRLMSVVRAAVGPVPIRDDSDLASGAPDGFVEAAAEAADYLGLIATGRIALVDRDITIAGRATTPEAYRTLTAFLETWSPGGFEVHSAIDLPIVAPYTLTASRLAGHMTISGFVPDDAARQAVKSAAGEGAVVETTLAAGAPDGFSEAAGFAIGLLSRLGEGTAVLSDRSIRLDGVAATAPDLIELEGTAAQPPSGFRVDLRTSPPVVSPYVWHLEKKPDQLVITGYAPSEAVRDAVRSRLESDSGDRAVVDRTVLGSGLPATADLVRIAEIADGLVRRLVGGTVSYSDGVISIEGRASSAADAAALEAAMKALPAGLVAGGTAVEPPPDYAFVVDRGLDTVLIEGGYADDDAKEAIMEEARLAFGRNADIEASLEPMTGLPDEAVAAARAAIDAASRLASGKATVTGHRLEVVGTPFTAAAGGLDAALARSLPAGFQLGTRLTPPPPGAQRDGPACLGEFERLLAANGIFFARGEAAVDVASAGFADRLAALGLACPTVRLRVEGFADAGTDVSVAAARAHAVAGIFADAGIDPARLEAIGAGYAEMTADVRPMVRITATLAPETPSTPAAPATEGGQ